MRNFVLALLFLLCPLVASAQLYAVRNVVPNGYNFWLYVPSDYKDCRTERQSGKGDNQDSITVAKSNLSEPLPIVVFLHGRSLSGTDLNKVRKYGTIDALSAGRKINAIVIAPQVTMSDWWRPNRVMNVIKWVGERYDVDMTRIYVLGMSLGGYGALDFAAAYPKETAAAMALCGGSTRKPSELGVLNEVPLWIMHGTADSAVPIGESRRVYNAMKAANGKTPRLRYDEFAGAGHSVFARAFYTGEAYEWLFKHSTADPSRPVDRTVQIPHSRLSSQPYRGLKFGSVKLKVVDTGGKAPDNAVVKPQAKSQPQAKAQTTTSVKSQTSTTSKSQTSTTSKSQTKPKATSQSKPQAKSQPQYHTIKEGDTLGHLAVKYDTTVKQICKWNNITETTILQLNKKLRVK